MTQGKSSRYAYVTYCRRRLMLPLLNPVQALSTEEMERLLSDLLRLSTPNYTHDGKLVLKIISTDEIGKMFQ